MAAVEFEIRVVGPVPTTVLEELEHIDVVTEPVDTLPVDTLPVDTLLRGPVQDQAALIGIIIRLQSWGIELRGIRQI